MILQITIRFLDNRYHGRGDGGDSEWPPSPFRIFQAMLAGAKSKWSDTCSDAFKWLQSLPQPVIHAPQARKTNGVLTYVPTNDADDGKVSRTPKMIQPRVMASEDRHIDYFWTYDQNQANAQSYAATIADCAGHIRCVGWGIDMAIGYGKHDLHFMPNPSPRLIVHTAATAANSSGNPLRVPCPGSLESLEKAYQHFIDRIRINPDTGKEEIHDQPGGTEFQTSMYGSSPGRPFCAFELQRIDNDGKTFSFNPRNIKSLVGMIRGLFGSARIRKAIGSERVDQMLLGHPVNSDGPRLSILPLLSVGHRHAGGRVARVILTEPFGSDGEVCHLLEEELDGKYLIPDGPNASPIARLIRLPRNDHFVARYYLRQAYQWATVSPVLLPGFDRRTGGSRRKGGTESLDRAEKLVLKSLQHAGIHLPCRVEIGLLSWWPGIPHARDFVPREKLGPAPRYHVKLTFDQRFTGPLSLGRQRHMGLGVFAAMDGSSSRG